MVRRRDPSFSARTELVKDGRQAAALDELHRVVVNAMVAADTEDRHDVRMMQLRGGLCLDLEPLPLLGVDRRGEGQHLQCDAPAQRNLLGLVDDAHSPAADLAEDPVFAELATGENRIGRVGPATICAPSSCGAAFWMNSSPERHWPRASAISLCRARNSSRDQGWPARMCFEIRLECRDHTRVVSRDTAH